MIQLTNWTHLSSSHAVKKVFLWSDSRQKPSINKPSCTRTCIIRQKRGQRAPAKHQGRSASFQLDLTQKARDLHTVNRRSLGARIHHELKVVCWESLVEPQRNARFVDEVLVVVRLSFHMQIQFFHVVSIFVVLSGLELFLQYRPVHNQVCTIQTPLENCAAKTVTKNALTYFELLETCAGAFKHALQRLR